MEPAPINQCRVLVVDDCEMNRNLLTTILKRKWGVCSDTAADGLEALAKLHESQFDLILMDIRMPFMDGFTAVSEIRRQWPDKNIPVVAVTASTGDVLGETYKAAGFTGSLHKPFAIKEIEHLISSVALQRHETTDRFLSEGK